MIIFLAGKPEDHQQINTYAEQLTAAGVQVISSWHRNDALAKLAEQSCEQKQAQDKIVSNFLRGAATGQISSLPDSAYRAAGGPPVDEMESAVERFQSEMKSADWVIADLDAASMEAGYAVALRKKIIAIGSSESMMFHFFLDKNKLVEDWPAAIDKVASIRILSRFSRGRPEIGEA